MIQQKGDIPAEFRAIKRALFDKYYSELNDMQREAVYTINGPLLVLAGAGSGKTTVLVRRIAHIIKFGEGATSDAVPEFIDENSIKNYKNALAFEKPELEKVLSEFAVSPCPPWSILAITFTNKAANEIKERLVTALCDEKIASDIWAGTFHSICMKILRVHAKKLGYENGFSIYDTDDQKRTVSACMKELDIDEKNLAVKYVMSIIGRTKDKLLCAEDFAAESKDFRDELVAKVFRRYTEKLKAANAMDFDDIIVQTVRLFEENPDVLEYYQNKFKYVCIDEYQDTNYAQFRLCELLAARRRNIMVVGDDDQSIYKFRGATIENILNFDRSYPNAKVIKLEQNYRSTKTILNAANSVIANNIGRRGKQLWTDGETGEKISLSCLQNQNEEARFIVDKVAELVSKENRKYNDFAVLYRMNAQANSLESAFAKSGVPYRVLGGMRFYDRKEIRDIVAYLHVISNHSDTLRLLRIINEPKRKIGQATIDAVAGLADETGKSFYEIIECVDDFVLLSKVSSKLKAFYELIENLTAYSMTAPVHSLIEKVICDSGYKQMLIDMGEEAQDRLENLEEFISGAIEYESRSDEPDLFGFLEEISLVSDIDKYDENSDAVVLMTMHSAKGLEFPIVFLPGMEDGIFPGLQSTIDNSELEEERRIAYVALTRAKERLFLSHVHERLLYGRTQYNPISRFAEEIPEEFLEKSYHSREENRINSGAYQRQGGYNTRDANLDGFFKPSTVSAKKTSSHDIEKFSAGDSVEHLTFGRGTILSVRPMGADILYEIAFDEYGTKKIMGTYAKLKRA